MTRDLRHFIGDACQNNCVGNYPRCVLSLAFSLYSQQYTDFLCSLKISILILAYITQLGKEDHEVGERKGDEKGHSGGNCDSIMALSQCYRYPSGPSFKAVTDSHLRRLAIQSCSYFSVPDTHLTPNNVTTFFCY